MAKKKIEYGIKISIDDKGGVKVLNALGKELKQVEHNASNSAKSVKRFGKTTQDVNGYVKKLTALVSGYLSLGFAKTLLNEADAIGKTAEKLGVGVEMLQKYRYAAELSGVSTQTFDMALQRFSRRVAEAARGTGEAKDALNQLGIQLTNDDGTIRNTESILLDVADAMTGVSDKSEKVRLSFKLFDSEGVAMVNMFNDGADGIKDMTDEAERLGIVMDKQTIATAEKAQDTFTTLASIFKTKMTIGLVGALEQLQPLISGFTEIISYEETWIAGITAMSLVLSVTLYKAIIKVATAITVTLMGALAKLQANPWVAGLTMVGLGGMYLWDRKKEMDTVDG